METPLRSMWTCAFLTSRCPTPNFPEDAHPLGRPCCRKRPGIFRFISVPCNPCRQGQCWCAKHWMKILDHQIGGLLSIGWRSCSSPVFIRRPLKKVVEIDPGRCRCEYGGPGGCE